MKKNQSLFGAKRRNNKLLRTLTQFWGAFFCVLVIIALSHRAHSQAVLTSANDDMDIETARSVLNKVTPLGDDYQNNITLLNNRFRIDDGVEKVIMIFFRQFGAQPVVLVRPDGSKLYLDNDQRDDSYKWYESDTYDMIELTNPMPGPWQALGEVLPGSEILVIANLTLEAQGIPSPIFSGETLKQTAVLLNAGEEVNFKEIRDVVILSIDFISTNHPDKQNFGLGAKNVARFEDNGMGLDESAGDGIFTGRFDLDITNGEWQPVFRVRTPLFSRELQGEKVNLLPNPILLSHIEDTQAPSLNTSDINDEAEPSSSNAQQSTDSEGSSESDAAREDEASASNSNSTRDNAVDANLNIQGPVAGFHTIRFSVDQTYIDPSSLMLEGIVRSPAGEQERFLINKLGDYERQIRVLNSAYGIYRIEATAYATTIDGRELVMKVPEYTFVTREPVIEIEAPEIDEAAVKAEQERLAREKAEQERKRLIAIIITINVILVILGMIAIFLIADKRKRPNSHLSLLMLNKVKSLIPKKKKNAEKDASNKEG